MIYKNQIAALPALLLGVYVKEIAHTVIIFLFVLLFFLNSYVKYAYTVIIINTTIKIAIIDYLKVLLYYHNNSMNEWGV